MNNVEKGFLGVAAVCAVVAGGWAFWEEAWTPFVDDVLSDTHGTVYWDVHRDGDALVLDYTFVDDGPQTVSLDVRGFRASGDDTVIYGVALDPGTHSMRIGGTFLKGYDGSGTMTGPSTVVRTDGGRPPAR